MSRYHWLAVLLLAPSTLRAQIDSSFPVVAGGPYRLQAAVYQAHSDLLPTTLVVVLHGDAPFNKPDYQDRFAAAVAQTYPRVVAAAILRPGYEDPTGRVSEGIRGEATGDSYNATNTDALAAAIIGLRDQFRMAHVVLVGHSGGAALSANLLGRHPEIAAAALLVSCPCDVTAWRQHMFAKTHFAGFQGAIETLSPITLTDSLPSTLRLLMLTGAKDDIAPTILTQAYAAKARAHGISVSVEILPEEGHEILLKPRVLAALKTLLQ